MAEETNTGAPSAPDAFLQAVSGARGNLETEVAFVRSLKQSANLSAAADAGEVIANLMLSLRHLEDAKMRLGKVVQAYQGGRSVYDEAPNTN